MVTRPKNPQNHKNWLKLLNHSHPHHEAEGCLQWLTILIMNWLDILVFFFSKNHWKEKQLLKQIFHTFWSSHVHVHKMRISLWNWHAWEKKLHMSMGKRNISVLRILLSMELQPSTRIQMLHVGIFQWRLFHETTKDLLVSWAELYTYS